MPSKFEFLFIFLLLVFTDSVEPVKQALISGGILYNKLTEAPVTVNPSTVVLYRHLNTSQLVGGVTLSGTYLNQYQELCEKLQRRIYTDNRASAEKDFYSLKLKYLVLDGERHCIEDGGVLPELRDIHQLLSLHNKMTLQKIKMVRAGIKRGSNSKFVFMSDLRDISENEFKSVFPALVTRYYENAAFHNEWYASEDAKNGYVFVYRIKNRGLELALVDPKQHMSDTDTIICQRTSKMESAKKIESNLLTKIAAHSCLRDMRNLIGTHQMVAREVALFRKNGKEDFPHVELTLPPSLFETEYFPKTASLSLNVQKVCKPLYLDECKIGFMEWLDRIFAVSKTWSAHAEVDNTLMKLYLLHQVVLSANTRAPSQFLNCETNYGFSKDDVGYALYLKNAIAEIMVTCPRYVPEFVASKLHDFLFEGNNNDHMLAFRPLINEYKLAISRSAGRVKRAPYFGPEKVNPFFYEKVNQAQSVFGSNSRGKRSPILGLFMAKFILDSSLGWKLLNVSDLENREKRSPVSNSQLYDNYFLDHMLIRKWNRNIKLIVDLYKKQNNITDLAGHLNNITLNKIKGYGKYKFVFSNQTLTEFLGIKLVNRPLINSSVFVETLIKITQFYEYPLFRKVGKRQKRFSPAGILGTVAAINGATSLATGDAPFSWFGNVIGATMGLVTRQELKIPFDAIKQHSVAIQNLTLNQHELETAYNALAKDLDRVDSATHAVELSTATLISEYDNKMVLKNLLDTIQLTLLKISQAMSNALNKHTSPYVLAPSELKEIAARYREENIQLSSNINDVTTTVTAVGDEIIFLFEVPIYNDRTLFNLYSARPLPLYDDGKSLSPILDITYFGASVKNNEYTILSDSEQLACLSQKICHVSDVLRRIEDTPHCVIKSFSKNQLTCPMGVSKDLTGFYELHGRKMVYSVPQTETLKMICRDKLNPIEEHNHSTVTVSGVGLADIAPDCQVILPNDRRLYSNPIPLQEQLTGANFMEVFNFLPELDNYTLEIRDQSIFNHTVFQTLNMREVDPYIGSFEDLKNETFNLKNSLPEALRVIIGILCVLSLFFLVCMCSRKFRTWFKTFILWKNPHKWYTEFRGIDMSTWTRRGTKYHRANRDIIKNRKLIEKVTPNTRKTTFSMDEREYNQTVDFSDPITRVCNARMNNLKPGGDPLPNGMWTPVDPHADPPSSNTSKSPNVDLKRSPAFRRKSVTFGKPENCPYPERPRTPNPPSYPEVSGSDRLYPPINHCFVTDPNSCKEIEKKLSSPKTIRRMMSETELRPLCDPGAVPPFRETRIRNTSSPATVRRWANPETRPHAHEEDSAVVATIATQSSLTNTPEPNRRISRRAPTPPLSRSNSLAQAMRDNNLSSVDVNSATSSRPDTLPRGTQL